MLSVAEEGEEEEDVDADDPVLDAETLACGGLRATAIPELVLDLGPGLGSVHYNVSGQYFRAHCPCHGDECRRQRTARESETGRAGQGRPIGLLVAWLQSAHAADSKEQHVRMKVAGLSARQEARRFFLGLPGSTDLTDREREKKPGEPDEPVTIP